MASLRSRLASLVLRGPRAALITHDLEDLYARERAGGMSVSRAKDAVEFRGSRGSSGALHRDGAVPER